MARLTHRCTKCGASDWFHEGPGCVLAREDTPIVVPTWETVWHPTHPHREILTITPPGVRWPETGRGQKTCACQECHRVYLMEGGDPALCRCRPCAIDAQAREDLAAETPVGFDIPTDLGPVSVDA